MDQDGSLGFRKSCAHGVCGSDAMRINGRDGLACKTLIKKVADKEGVSVTIEPLRHLPILDDANGVWPCENHFKCTQSCLQSILITKRINQTKRMLEKSLDSDGD